jgi:predicted O-methyltransferase YrrM
MTYTEGSGQLLPNERKTLYELVLATQPTVVLEAGTWNGDGSTRYIAEALLENGSGVLTTYETDRDRYASAVELYSGRLSYLAPYVRLLHGPFVACKCDFAFLDGSEDPRDTVAQAMDLVIMGCPVIAVHDWEEVNSTKTDLLELSIARPGFPWKLRTVVGHLAILERT